MFWLPLYSGFSFNLSGPCIHGLGRMLSHTCSGGKPFHLTQLRTKTSENTCIDLTKQVLIDELLLTGNATKVAHSVSHLICSCDDLRMYTQHIPL